MSTPEIMALDAALSRAGEDVTLSRVVRRGGANVTVSVACRAGVRSVGADQIVGSIAANDMNVIMSPTQIINGAWPGQDDGVPSGNNVDQRLPKTTDKIVVQGRERQVKLSKPIFVGGAWVRTDLVVSG